MPLLNPQVSADAGATPQADGKSFAEKKAEAAERFKNKRRQQLDKVAAFLKQLPNCPADIAEIADNWLNPRSGGTTFGEPLFTKIFGATPKVGDSVTLQDVFTKTLKGADKMSQMIKKWSSSNTAVVEYVHNATDPIKSQYVIKKIGA